MKRELRECELIANIFSVCFTEEDSYFSLLSNTIRKNIHVKQNILIRISLTQEQILLHIWHHVLQIPDIDIHDNFFELGGTALQGAQVHCMAHKKGIQFTLQQFILNPTIHGLLHGIHNAPTYR